MGACLAFLSQQRRRVSSFASRIAFWRTRQLDNASRENKESLDPTVCNHSFVEIIEDIHDPSVDELNPESLPLSDAQWASQRIGQTDYLNSLRHPNIPIS
ncbi:unnamed protein product [Caenorhabditis nigoni]